MTTVFLMQHFQPVTMCYRRSGGAADDAHRARHLVRAQPQGQAQAPHPAGLFTVLLCSKRCFHLEASTGHE